MSVSGSPDDHVFESSAIFRIGGVSGGIFLGTGALVFLTNWATGRVSDYLLTAFLLLFAAGMAVWPFRSRISLTESTLVDINMRRRVVSYSDIQSAEVRNSRYDMVVLTLKNGKELSLGSSVGLRVHEIASAINGRLADEP